MAHADSERFKNGKIRLFSRLRLRNIFPGEWESIYTGEGIEFSATKPYEPGDDVRRLDLQTLVETGEEEITLQAVGRQRKIYIWLDLSGSMQRLPEMFFAQKSEIRDIAAGIVAFSACGVYSPVGLCAFGREIRQFFPARSGERYCNEIVRWLLDHGDEGDREMADILKALAFLEDRIDAQSLVFFISDFQEPVFDGRFSPLLESVAKKFDFVPVVIRDPLECSATIRHSVVIAVRDSETSRHAEISLKPPTLVKMQEASARHLAHLEKNFREVDLEQVALDSPLIDDCVQRLSIFFEARKRKRTRQ
jgi:uncharacterized protein (DUF58 family)